MIPAPPLDASVLSIYQAFALHEGLDPDRENTLRTFFGDAEPAPFSFLIPQAKHISEVVFGGRYSAEELVRRHSLTSIVCTGQRNAMETSLKHCGMGNLDREVAVKRKHARKCPECVREDKKIYGYAYWRLSHQWWPLRSCLVHDRPLESTCRRCFEKLGPRSLSYRADTSCTYCKHAGSAALKQVSNPFYEALVDAYASLRWAESKLTLTSIIKQRLACVAAHRNYWEPLRPSGWGLEAFFESLGTIWWPMACYDLGLSAAIHESSRFRRAESKDESLALTWMFRVMNPVARVFGDEIKQGRIRMEQPPSVWLAHVAYWKCRRTLITARMSGVQERPWLTAAESNDVD